ncbi:hypothetical protein CRUP_035222 [Coryphaenoides rupestris]|nr:hypothetical protein CRUP_035222 [Coryphaenoides rupestris]
MEPKHRELLDRCHQNLLESITDADRLVDLLVGSGALSPVERFELEQNCTTGAEKVDHLLKVLRNDKESDHFLDLCVALEKAYPDLHSSLFAHNGGGGPVDHSTARGDEEAGSEQQLYLPSPTRLTRVVYGVAAKLSSDASERHAQIKLERGEGACLSLADVF